MQNKVWLLYCESLEDNQSTLINIFSTFEKADDRALELIEDQDYDYSCIDDLHEYKIYDKDDNVYICYQISEEEVL